MARVFVGGAYRDDCFVLSSRRAIAPHRLFTFAFDREWNEEMEKCHADGCSLMLDSGAFSVMTGTAKVDREEHVRFVERYGDRFELKAALDVMTDAHASLENYVWQRARVDVFPVFHARDPWWMLMEYVALGATRIGLSGVLSTGKGGRHEGNMAYLHKVFAELTDSAGRPLVHTHGFAMGTGRTVTSFPWTTVDSTTATRAAERGMLLLFRGSECVQLHLRGDAVLLYERVLGAEELDMLNARLAENEFTLEEVREFFPLRVAFNTMEMVRSHVAIPETYSRPDVPVCLF